MSDDGAELMPTKHIVIRVICVDPPLSDNTDTTRFGVQDKDKNLVTGDKNSTGALVFNVELDVKQHADDTPNFTGTYAHGNRAERFLYLTLMTLQGGSWDIVKRIKIPLKTITWKQVQSVIEDDSKILRVKVGGQSSGTVPLLDDGWSVISR